MPAMIAAPKSFEIEAVSAEVREPENEGYIIRIRLNGTYEVRSFLSDLGVDEKRIARAIAELGHTKQVTVSN